MFNKKMVNKVSDHELEEFKIQKEMFSKQKNAVLNKKSNKTEKSFSEPTSSKKMRFIASVLFTISIPFVLTIFVMLEIVSSPPIKSENPLGVLVELAEENPESKNSPCSKNFILTESFEQNSELQPFSDGSFISKVPLLPYYDKKTSNYSIECGFDKNVYNEAYQFTYTDADDVFTTVTVPKSFVTFKQNLTSSVTPPTVKVLNSTKKKHENPSNQHYFGLYEISINTEQYSKIMNNK